MRPENQLADCVLLEAWKIPFTKAIQNTLVRGAVVSLRIRGMTVLYRPGLKGRDDDTWLGSLIAISMIKSQNNSGWVLYLNIRSKRGQYS